MFSQEELAFQDMVRQAYDSEIRPLVEAQPQDRPLSAEVCGKLLAFAQPFGLLGARVPPSLGGSGLGPVKLALASEIMPFEVWEVLMLPEIVAFRIAVAGSDELKERMLPLLLAGKNFSGSATSELNAGSDPQGIEATATPEGDGYRIRGTKLWCCGGNLADILLVVASRGRSASGRNMLTPFIIEKAKSPYEAEPHSMLGLRRSQVAKIEIDCWVPKENMVGDQGSAHSMLNKTWLSQRPIMGLASNNISKRALDFAVERARERKQFNRQIGSFQLIQSMIAEMATAVEASRMLCYRAIRLAEAGEDCMRETAMAKYFSVKNSLEVTNSAVEICGANGILQGSIAEQCFRDARTLAFIEGTMEIQKLIIAREVLGIRAFS